MLVGIITCPTPQARQCSRTAPFITRTDAKTCLAEFFQRARRIDRAAQARGSLFLSSLDRSISSI